MKLGTTLLASAAVLFVGHAMAADITSPFYLPQAGKFLSDTSLAYSRYNMDRLWGDDDLTNSRQGWYAKEQIFYGVTDNFSLSAALGNSFDNKVASMSGFIEYDYNDSYNFDYTVGAAYNYNFDKLLTQVYASYNTFKPKSFFGPDEYTNDWNEYATFGGKLGYSMGGGDFIPYIDFKATYGVSDPNRDSTYYKVGSPQEHHWSYSTFAGVHKKWDVVSTDLGIRWDHVRHDYFARNYKDDAFRNDVYAQGSVNYFIKEDMTIGLYGDYLVGSTNMGNTNEDYTVGANFKIGF